MSDIKFKIPTPKALMAASSVRYRELTRCGQKPLAGGKIFTYEVNSTTPKPTYRDASGLTPNTNPVVLDAAGEADIYLDGAYRIVVKDKNDVVQKDMDNINGWITGGVEAQLESLNMVLRESSQSILEPYAQAIDVAAAAGAGAQGWDESLVAVNNGTQTQKYFNDRSTQCVESFEDLREFNPRRNGFVVYLKSYHVGLGLGGGHFYYNQYSTAEEDNGTVVKINGFPGALERVNVSPVFPEMFGAKADGLADDTRPIQDSFNYVSPIAWQGTIAKQNNLGGSGIIRFNGPEYRFTKTLWIGAYINIKGSGELGFKSQEIKDATKLTADLDDVRQPAISSSNWKVDGTRVAFDVQTSGAMYDQSQVSGTHGIKISGISLVAAKQSHIGLRIQNSPQSSILGFYVSGFDYGIVLNASWQSIVIARTIHNKCGLLAHNDNNGLIVEGYYNSSDVFILESSKNFLTQFGGDSDTDSLLNNRSVKFGVSVSYGLSTSSRQLICEHNDVGLAISNGDAAIQTLYTEGNKISSIVSFSSSVSITNITGYFDASSFLIGANANIEIDNYSQGNVANPIKKISQYNARLITNVKFPFYKKGVFFKNSKNILYVSSSGNDAYNGRAASMSVKTVDAALKIIAESNLYFTDSSKEFTTLEDFTIVFLDSQQYAVANDFTCNSKIKFKTLDSQTRPTLTLNKQFFLSGADVSFENFNVIKPDIKYSPNESSNIQNGGFVFDNGTNCLDFIGCNINILNYGLSCINYSGSSNSTLILNNCNTTATGAVLVQSNYQDAKPHIVSVLRSGGAIDSSITSRPDKGILVPAGWQSKVLGL